jgi:hypothetical protein
MQITGLYVPCPKCCIGGDDYEKLRRRHFTLADREGRYRKIYEYRHRLTEEIKGFLYLRTKCWQMGPEVRVKALYLRWGRSCLNEVTETGEKCGYEYGKGFVFKGEPDDPSPRTQFIFRPEPYAINGLEKSWVRKDLPPKEPDQS